MDAPNRKNVFDLADKFIHLANELSREHGIGEVSTAIRYAAARYNAFEVSTRTSSMIEAREDAIQWFSDQFKLMFMDNMDQIIDQQGREVN